MGRTSQLKSFLEPYPPSVRRLFFAVRRAVLLAAPRATELVYDAYNAVASAYSFTDRMKEAFCHIAAYSQYVNLGFNHGARLADPDDLLVGTGAHIRHIRITDLDDLERPAVRRLIRAAVAQGRALAPALPAKARSIVKGVAVEKRRPK